MICNSHSFSYITAARDCLEARPPLPLDLSGPTVFSYHPANDPPQMTSFPSYTFRPKTQSDRGKVHIETHYTGISTISYGPHCRVFLSRH